MNITILGAGNGGVAMAADLSLKKHNVTLCKTSQSIHDDNFEAIQRENGRISLHDRGIQKNACVYKVTRNLSEALTPETELVVLFIQSNYHKNLIKKIVPFLHDGQIIFIQPGYLSTLYFMKYAKDLDLTIVEAESSPMDCRLEKPGEVSVKFRNIRNPISVYPKAREQETMEKLKTLDYHFTLLDSAVEAALHNPNLIVHTIGAIMSIPRIEYSNGDYWMYREVFTKSVWNLVLQLDREKMAVLKRLGFSKMSYTDACRFRNSEDLTIDSEAVFHDYAQNKSVAGPFVSNSRYITEDVPEGLVLLESLGELLQIDTPICTSLINIAAACLSTDFRSAGRRVQPYQKEYHTLISDANSNSNHC